MEVMTHKRRLPVLLRCAVVELPSSCCFILVQLGYRRAPDAQGRAERDGSANTLQSMDARSSFPALANTTVPQRLFWESAEPATCIPCVRGTAFGGPKIIWHNVHGERGLQMGRYNPILASLISSAWQQ